MAGELWGRAVDYATAHGVEIVLVDVPGEPENRCFLAKAGLKTLMFLERGTADSPDCGEVVYQAIEALVDSAALKVNVHTALLPSSGACCAEF